jgi:hypothetical protein
VRFLTLRYARGATVNRGNFNSDRIEFEATVEVDTAFESPEAADARLREWVNQRVKFELGQREPKPAEPAVLPGGCKACHKPEDFHPWGGCKEFVKP